MNKSPRNYRKIERRPRIQKIPDLVPCFVNGNCMAPALEHGDTALMLPLQREVRFSKGRSTKYVTPEVSAILDDVSCRPCVIYVNGHMQVKRVSASEGKLHQLVLSWDNPDDRGKTLILPHNPTTERMTHEVRIAGTIVGVIKASDIERHSNHNHKAVYTAAEVKAERIAHAQREIKRLRLYVSAVYEDRELRQQHAEGLERARANLYLHQQTLKELKSL